MGVKFFLLAAVFIVNVFAAETVTKSSTAFSFPTAVGVNGKDVSQMRDVAFVSSIHLNGKKIIDLSWSLPKGTGTGSISVYNMLGSKVKTFTIKTISGVVRWDISGEKTPAGIYFAKLSFGKYNKNLKLVLAK